MTREGRSKSVEVQRVWEVFDDRLQYMAMADASRLDDALQRRDVSAVWMLWSGAAGAALAGDFCWGAVPGRGLGRGVARFRTMMLGGPKGT